MVEPELPGRPLHFKSQSVLGEAVVVLRFQPVAIKVPPQQERLLAEHLAVTQAQVELIGVFVDAPTQIGVEITVRRLQHRHQQAQLANGAVVPKARARVKGCRVPLGFSGRLRCFVSTLADEGSASQYGGENPKTAVTA